MTSSTTSSSLSTTAAAAAPKKAAEMEKILAEIRSHEKSALFAGNTSAHNPDLQMSLDAVQIKMDKGHYKRPRDFAQDMSLVFTVDANSPLASAAASFKILFQCLLDKYGMTSACQGNSSTKRHRLRGSKRTAKAEVFDFVAEFEEELSSGFLFEGEQFLDDDDDDDSSSSSEELRLFSSHKDVDDDDSSADDFVPLNFSFEQESVLDGRSPALYSELLGEYGWTEWEDPVSDDPASPKTDEGDSSFPSSPLSTPISSSSSTATSPISGQTKLRGKRQRSSSLRVTSMRWSKEELLFKITNELPSDKLEGIIMIVNPSLEFGDTDDEDLEFDINALDETTLYRLEDYVHACLADGNDHGNESMMERGTEIITITQTIEETVTTTSPRKRTRTKGQNTASTRSSRKAAKKSSSTTTTTPPPPPPKTKNAPQAARQTLPSPASTPTTTTTKKSSTRSQRRKNTSPSKTTTTTTKSPASSTTKSKTATTTKTTQVIETTICHFVEQDEDFNYIPHSRGDRLNTLVPEAFEVFRTEQVIKVQKSVSDSDMEEEEVDII